MSIFGASFVRASSETARDFQAVCLFISEWNAAWLAESPTHKTYETIIRAHKGTSWISIQNAVSSELLVQISGKLGGEALAIFGSDEIDLEFSYHHSQSGKTVRKLVYVWRGTQTGKWTTVEGAAESWELLLFSPHLMDRYEKYAAGQDVSEVRKQEAIMLGNSIPSACCDRRVVAEIVQHLQLPYDAWHDRFPASVLSQVIPGSR